MKLIVRLPQAAAGYMSINLGRADGRMPEQFLDDAQVRAILQQVCGKAVSQHMRRDVSANAGAANSLFDPKPKCYRGERGAATGEKDIGG